MAQIKATHWTSAVTTLILCLALLATHGSLAIAQPRPQAADKPLAAVEALKQKQRDSLRDLEASTRVTRNGIIEELGDPYAIQNHAIEQAEQEYKTAELATISAEFALKNYTEGVLRQDLATARGEIALCKNDMERAGVDLKLAEESKQKGKFVHEQQLESKRLTAARADFAFEEASLQLEVLDKYTGPKECARLNDSVKAAHLAKAEKQERLKREQILGEKLKTLIKRSNARSPEDFLIFLVNDAVKCEERVFTLTQEARGSEAQIREKPTDQALLDQLKQKRDEITRLMDQAKGQLLAAAQLGNHLQKQRVELAEAEARLKRERAIVDAAEKIVIPTP